MIQSKRVNLLDSMVREQAANLQHNNDQFKKLNALFTEERENGEYHNSLVLVLDRETGRMQMMDLHQSPIGGSIKNGENKRFTILTSNQALHTLQ